MRYAEWGILLVISGLGIALANFIGFDVGFMESLPGILILLGISAAAVVLSKLVPLRLPIVAYCSIIGLLAASPLCPAREFVIASANSINFTAPLTLVGAYAGISIGDQGIIVQLRNLHFRIRTAGAAGIGNQPRGVLRRLRNLRVVDLRV